MSEGAMSEEVRPTREELQAELAPVPEPPEPPPPPQPPGTEELIAAALTHVRGKRGADLVAVIMVGSGARRALTPHSDINFIALVKGSDEADEIVHVASRYVDVRYRSHVLVDQELAHALRLPPLLRKGRVLFEHDQIGTKLVEKAGQRFRQGPPAVGMNERIRMKAHCQHVLGKAEDFLQQQPAQPAAAQYLLNRFVTDLLETAYRLKGFWYTAPAEMLRFLSSRDQALGQLIERFLSAPTPADQLEIGRQLIGAVFKDTPNPARID